MGSEVDRNDETALALDAKTGFHGVPCVSGVDAKTGFLEAPRHDGISAETKLNILELFRKHGDLSQACHELGVEPRMIRWHRANDPAFKEAYDEVIEQITDRAEGSVVRHFDATPADRIFWLKTRRAAIYGDRPQTVNHNVTLVKQIAAEVEQNRLKRQVE